MCSIGSSISPIWEVGVVIIGLGQTFDSMSNLVLLEKVVKWLAAMRVDKNGKEESRGKCCMASGGAGWQVGIYLGR